MQSPLASRLFVTTKTLKDTLPCSVLFIIQHIQHHCCPSSDSCPTLLPKGLTRLELQSGWDKEWWGFGSVHKKQVLFRIGADKATNLNLALFLVLLKHVTSLCNRLIQSCVNLLFLGSTFFRCPTCKRGFDAPALQHTQFQNKSEKWASFSKGDCREKHTLSVHLGILSFESFCVLPTSEHKDSTSPLYVAPLLTLKQAH